MIEGRIKHVAGIAEIVEDIEAAARYYEGLGLSVEGDLSQGYATLEINGILHFGLWSRERAAQVMFGDGKRANEVPYGFTVGFEVDDVPSSEHEMAELGIRFLQSAKQEPWGQETARFLLPSGSLGEISVTPWARHITQQLDVSE